MANKVYIVYFFIICLFLFSPTNTFPQSKEIQFEHITVEDGLPDNTIYGLTQDYLGFMWFGTNNGLVKYDGYKMTVYQPDETDSNSISDADLVWIFEDQSRNLWISHTNGISLYNRDSDNFKNYLYVSNRKISFTIYQIFEDSDGILWLSSGSNGLMKLIKNPERFESGYNIIDKKYVHDPIDPTSIASNLVLPIYQDKSGTLWVGSAEGLCKLNRKTDTFTTYKAIKDTIVDLHNWINTIFEDSKGNFWIGTQGEGLAKFDRKTGGFEFVSFEVEGSHPLSWSTAVQTPNVVIGSIIENTDGSFWIPTYGGGIINFNPITKNFVSFVHNPENPFSLSFCNDRIYTLYMDYAKVLWIATYDGGVNKLIKERENFYHIKFDHDNSNGLSHRLVTCIYEDGEGTIWIGTSGKGLNRYNKQTGKFTHFTFNATKTNSIGSNYIKSIFEDKEGILWIGTLIGGLNKFNKSTETFTSFNFDAQNSKSLSDNDVTSICEDKAGNLWIGTEAGVLEKFDKSKGEFIHYFDSKSRYSFGTGGGYRIYDMYIDAKGIIWFIGIRGYLNEFDPETDSLITYKFNKVSMGIKSCSIYEDTKSRIWIGRELEGLVCFDKKDKSYKIYNKEDGLPDETVGAILEDDNGYLWMRTGTAICRFNPEDETFKVFELSQGYQMFNRTGALKSKRTGEMYFSGDDGFYIFDPASIQENSIPPKIAITDFRIFDESVQIGKDTPLKKHISVADEVILEHWQNDFSIEYAVLHYTNQERNKHRYILSGYDENWRTGDVNRMAKYTNMSQGEYVFKVIGSNSDGVWNEEGASISIIILPPWWATTWAYLAYALLIIGTIYLVWKMQLKRVRNKHEFEMSKFEAEKLHEVDEMKSRFFANLSHEFRTPLTLIFGPAKDIIDKTKDLDAKQNAGIIKRNASRLYGLVNQLLDLSKLEAGKMKLEASEQNIVLLLKGYILSFSSLAERKKITLNFNTIEENLEVYIDKDKVEKIVNNLLSNAFKFTPEGGKIDFTVEKLIDDAEIRIADNGIGIAKERMDKIFDRFYQVDGSHTREGEGTGIGLALTKELVELHNGKIEVESEYGKGTTLKILLPLGKDHLKPEEIIEKEIKEDDKATIEETELIPEKENRKEKTDIDILMETDKPLLLIVEDNSDLRKYIISHLEDDYRIQDAVDGEDGLQEALKHIPDLIISDIMMPKMDGFKLCEKLKTDERTSHIPVILLTAKATNQDKIEGLETGADDYIMKPFDAEVLKVRIKNLIEQRRKLREHFKKVELIELEDKEITSIDKKFLQNVIQVINKHLSDTSFNVEMLANEISMNRRNLDRKLEALTGESPGDLTRRLRLIYASKLLKRKFGNISEIALEVGFSNPAYFSKCFREQYGLTPSEYETNQS